jgi:WD40 repeat protein
VVAITRGDVLIGGSLGYVEDITRTASFVQYIEAFDDLGNPLRITGITFSPAGEPFFTHGDPDQLTDKDPHDVVYLSKNPNTGQPGLAVLIARLDDTLELWTYDLDSNVVHTYTGLAVDAGWAHADYTKIDVLCDSKTILYSDRGRTIFKYDLTGSGTQLGNASQLDVGDPYIYAAFKVIRPGQEIVVAKTASGNGPRNAICLDSDRISLWTDEINPPGDYHVFRRMLADGTDGPTYESVTVSLAPGVGGVGNNGEVFSLGCYYNPCLQRRHVFVWNVG